MPALTIFGLLAPCALSPIGSLWPAGSRLSLCVIDSEPRTACPRSDARQRMVTDPGGCSCLWRVRPPGGVRWLVSASASLPAIGSGITARQLEGDDWRVAGEHESEQQTSHQRSKETQ
jgi:hypothetical protein